MSRYTSHVKREERPWRIHPIWRGIGCLWLILLPVMSYAASWLIVRQVMLTSGFRSFIDRFYISSGVNLLPQSMYNRVVWPSIQLNQFYLDFNVLLRLLPDSRCITWISLYGLPWCLLALASARWSMPCYTAALVRREALMKLLKNAIVLVRLDNQLQRRPRG